MNKEVTIGFKDQSKTVVSEVKIKYTFEDEDLSSEKFISDDDILLEARSLHEKADSYAKMKSLER